MDRSRAMDVLGAIAAGIKKGKPSWYENASDEEKRKFDDWVTERLSAIDFAIDALRAENKMKRLQTMSHEVCAFIDNLLGGDQ